MFTFAQLSDPHLPLPPPRWSELLSKRATGWLSWTRKRRFIHRPEALGAVVTDLRARAPDLTVVTGDIANISTPAEYDQAARWLSGLGAPRDVMAIPGNHDLYVKPRAHGRPDGWAPFLAGDPAASAGPADPVFGVGFPTVRRRGGVAFVGLSTAVPKPAFIATGTLGAAQIERFEVVMRELAAEGACRVVLIHHPPQIGGASWRKELTDAGAFRLAVGRVGAELVLHGHNHRASLARIDTPAGPVAVLGAPSASAAPGSRYGAGGYHLVGVERVARGWRFDVDLRVIADDLAGCVSGRRFDLVAPAATPAAMAA
ncbi:MAG: metallophosphoesterase [Rhodospirillales bacterium]|nr:metallophosphoesterase [Rhodospirillales bacterium]